MAKYSYLVALSVVLISKERRARVSTGGVSRICKNGEVFCKGSRLKSKPDRRFLTEKQHLHSSGMKD